MIKCNSLLLFYMFAFIDDYDSKNYVLFLGL